MAVLLEREEVAGLLELHGVAGISLAVLGPAGSITSQAVGVASREPPAPLTPNTWLQVLVN